MLLIMKLLRLQCTYSLALIFCAICLRAQSLPVIQLSPEQQILPIGKYVGYYEDKTHTLKLSDIQHHDLTSKFTPSKSEAVSFGITTSVYWVAFTIQNQNPSANDWMLELAHPILDTITVYVRDTDGVWRSTMFGDCFPFRQREIVNRNFVLSLNLPDTMTHIVYLRIASSSSLQVPLTLYRRAAFYEQAADAQIWYGIYYGAMLILIVYNLFLGFSLRALSYLYYSLYITGVVSYFAYFNGHIHQYVLGNIPLLSNYSVLLFLMTGLVGLGLFTQQFLNTKIYTPRLHRAWNYLILFTILIVGSVVVIEYSTVVKILAQFTVPIIVFAVITGIVCLLRGNLAARFFIAGLLVFTTGTGLNFLIFWGHAYRKPFVGHLAEIGSVLEGVILSLALANRYRLLRLEKEAAQQEALRIQHEANERLEEKVRERTQELETSNEEILRQVAILDEQANTIELANATLHEKNFLMEQLDHEKNEFLGIAAHDLKNPLASIILSIETMQRYAHQMTAEQIEQRQNGIKETAQRMMSIITNLLDINTLESGKIAISIKPIDVSAIVRRVVYDYDERAKLKNIHLYTIDADAPHYALADANIVEEILDNLVSNAVKYSPSSKRVWVSVVSDIANNSLLLTVKDEGQGLTAEDKSRLFGKFARLSARPTSGEHSTGLGLSIVKKLVEALNGRVWCESEQGNGATFIVELPKNTLPRIEESQEDMA